MRNLQILTRGRIFTGKRKAPEKARKYEAVAGFAHAGEVFSVSFVLLHRRIARGERRRPRVLKRQPRFTGNSPRILRIEKAQGDTMSLLRSKNIQTENRPDCSKRLRYRSSGRRTILLRLSGFPCRYHRRVDCTNSSTSDDLQLSYLHYSTIIRVCKVLFYFLSDVSNLFHRFQQT